MRITSDGNVKNKPEKEGKSHAWLSKVAKVAGNAINNKGVITLLEFCQFLLSN